MLDPIIIGTAKNPEGLISKLDSELQMLQTFGFEIAVDINEMGKYKFLDCKMFSSIDKYSPDCLEDIEIVKSYLANAVAEVILEDWEKHLIKKIIRNNYYYFSEEEKLAISQKAQEIMEKEKDYYAYQKLKQRKNNIVARIIDYLDLGQELIIEGFVNFRLKDYVLELEDTVDNAVDGFLMEKEYLEFIRLLRYFVDIQEPRVEKVHVIIKEKGGFNLLDEVFKPINNDYLEGFVLDLIDNDINYDDLLISALITLAPKKVILHSASQEKNKEAIKTVNHVFGKRASICEGCGNCISNS